MEQNKQIADLYYKALKEEDFITFASFCRIYSDFKNDFIFLRYENWTYAQKEFERNRIGKDIVLKPRRIGFTTLELARDLFHALTNPGSTVMIVAQEFSLAKKAIQDIKNFIDYILDIEKKIGYQLLPKVKLSNVKEIIFDTNSRIIGEVAKNQESSADRTGRGIGVNRLHCTEVAFWSFPELTMKSLMNAAKFADEIVIESTPNGATGYFYDRYTKIKSDNLNGWKSHFFPWYLHEEYKMRITKEDKVYFEEKPQNEYEIKLIEEIGISREQLNWWRQQVSETDIKSVLQEFPIDDTVCFRSTESTFFTNDDFEYLSSCFEEPIVLYPVCCGSSLLKIWKEPQNNRDYILGADCSYGRKMDHSAFYVIDKMNGEICCGYSSNEVSPGEFAKIIVEVATKYNKAYVGIEIQGPGQAVITAVQIEGYWKLFRHENKDYYGWNTTANKRTEMFNLFQKMVKDRDPKLVDILIGSEAKTLIFKDGKIQHPKGYHDDHLMAFMISQKVREESPVMSNTGYSSIKQSAFSAGMSTSNRIGRIGGFSLKN